MIRCHVVSVLIGLVIGLAIGALATGVLVEHNEAVDLGYGLAVIREMTKQLSDTLQRERALQDRVKELEQREKARP